MRLLPADNDFTSRTFSENSECDTVVIKQNPCCMLLHITLTQFSI